MDDLIFETPRLWGRRLRAEDEEALLIVYGDAETMRWVGDGQTLTREQCSQWIDVTYRNYATRGYGLSALVLRETGVVIGFCGLVHPGGQPDVELKYALARPYWGRGLATEAARAMLAFGAEKFQMVRVIATAYPQNRASHQVLKKSGMQAAADRYKEDGTVGRVFVWSPERSKEIILPGATLGILGSGQLGRMLALEARAMGYRVHTLSPDTDTPTGQVADLEVTAAYDDLDAVREFARGVDVVTFEFENVPAATVEAALSIVPVRPGGRALHIAQHRGREKAWLLENGIPCAPFRHVGTREELGAALEELGTPAILKTAGFGYDGKGQVRIYDAAEADVAWETLGEQPCVLEGFVSFEREISVVGVRGLDGAFEWFGPIQNSHVNGILDVSVDTLRGLPLEVPSDARELTRRIMEGLEVIGVLCVEFFVTSGGGLFVNEMAPRPHNSGHLTIEGHATSQFGQQLRAVCGLPLGSSNPLRPAAMANLLGDLWAGGEPDWAAALALRGSSQSEATFVEDLPTVSLHLYGKAEPKPGRKMGHLTAVADTAEEAERLVRQARAALTGASAG